MKLILPIILTVIFGAWVWYLKQKVTLLKDRLAEVESAQQRKREKKQMEAEVAKEVHEVSDGGGINTFELK